MDAAVGALIVSAAGLSLANALHCAGMCGAFALVARGRPEWHVGRAATYLALGAGAGAIGGAVGVTGAAPAVRIGGAIVASLVLVAFSLQLGGFLSRPVSAVARPLAPLAALLRDLARTDHGGLRAVLSRVALGAAGSLVPCGVVYAGLALAAVSGGAAAGAAVMGGFALGTVPALVATAAGRKLFARWGRNLTARRAAALVALTIGLASIWMRAPMMTVTADAGDEPPTCHTP